jgi:hypothetical protein
VREWPSVAAAMAESMPAPTASVVVAAPTMAWPSRERGAT